MAGQSHAPLTRRRRAYLLITVICALATMVLLGLAAFSTPRLPWLVAGMGFLSATSVWVANLRALPCRVRDDG